MQMKEEVDQKIKIRNHNKDIGKKRNRIKYINAERDANQESQLH